MSSVVNYRLRSAAWWLHEFCRNCTAGYTCEGGTKGYTEIHHNTGEGWWCVFTERGWRAQVSEGSFCRKSRQLCGLLVSYGRVACLIWEGLRMCVGKKSHQENSTISCKQTAMKMTVKMAVAVAVAICWAAFRSCKS